jgi:pyruvate formate lyase activating enzyme
MDFFRKKQNKSIVCTACARYCEIEDGCVGYCGVRQNIKGKLKLLSYGNFLFLKKVDKKMLVGGLGSNMRMPFDPNWDSSLFPFLNSQLVGREKTNEQIKNLGYHYEPNELIEYVKEQGCEEIVFQFNEPLVYIEYILEICKQKEIKTSIITTGYFSKEVLNKLLPVVDEICFLFFSTFDKFYIKHCSAQLPVIKENIRTVFESDVELKVICPLIPGENDALSICKFLKNISPLIPLSFLKFVPTFRMLDKEATTREELIQAVNIAREVGLKNVDFIA